MSDLVFYTNPQSRGRIAHWMLEEIGQPYETVWLEFGPSMKSAEYLAINPMGKVPALRHCAALVTEAAAICSYLADRFPEKALSPATQDPARAAYFRWLFFAAGPLELAVTARTLDWQVPEGKSGSSVSAATARRLMPLSRRCCPDPTCVASSSPPPMCMPRRSLAGA